MGGASESCCAFARSGFMICAINYLKYIEKNLASFMLCRGAFGSFRRERVCRILD